MTSTRSRLQNQPVRKCIEILQDTTAGILTYVELQEVFQAPQLRHITAQTLNKNITNILLNEHMVIENYKLTFQHENTPNAGLFPNRNTRKTFCRL